MLELQRSTDQMREGKIVQVGLVIRACRPTGSKSLPSGFVAALLFTKIDFLPPLILSFSCYIEHEVFVDL